MSPNCCRFKSRSTSTKATSGRRFSFSFPRCQKFFSHLSSMIACCTSEWVAESDKLEGRFVSVNITHSVTARAFCSSTKWTTNNHARISLQFCKNSKVHFLFRNFCDISLKLHCKESACTASSKILSVSSEEQISRGRSKQILVRDEFVAAKVQRTNEKFPPLCEKEMASPQFAKNSCGSPIWSVAAASVYTGTSYLHCLK